ncbi:dTMP kinase [Corynebacterium sp. MSK008]|uniref:dTMP kinase n=1 Tax=Corynebacterium sp. MSK008 TaxID=3050188 RepID=UPI0025514F53|nr:dTMP kinase [Corynebacterium sp. MSK008]MDK8879920.1 dTMP kinase [Corynebacterium sp. MSK008]
MIVAVEGIDGAGKNTLVTALKERLGAETLAFPRYETSVHAQLAQDALHGRMGDLTDSAFGMATMFALDRHGAKELLDGFAGHRDRIIILDRYVASNAAYTSARTGDAAAVKWVLDLEFEKLELPKPDLQVLVDTTPDVARERAQAREEQDVSRTRDRYERDVALQVATFQAYAELAEQNWVSRWLRTADPAVIMQAVNELAQ